jgi:hypothetical protein
LIDLKVRDGSAFLLWNGQSIGGIEWKAEAKLLQLSIKYYYSKQKVAAKEATTTTATKATNTSSSSSSTKDKDRKKSNVNDDDDDESDVESTRMTVSIADNATVEELKKILMDMTRALVIDGSQCLAVEDQQLSRVEERRLHIFNADVDVKTLQEMSITSLTKLILEKKQSNVRETSQSSKLETTLLKTFVE